MKILIIHNQYSRLGGEESVVELQKQLLKRNGHTVIEYSRRHGEVGKFQRLFTAVRNKQSMKDVEEICRQEKPDVAIIHNLFPVISAAIIPVLKKAGVCILMTLHNYRLVCPNGLFYTHGKVCERCGNGGVINCLLRRCEGTIAGSAAWSLRAALSRKYYEGVDVFMALSKFQRNKITKYSKLNVSKFRIVPNCIDEGSMPRASQKTKKESYIAYVGRLSQEKGVNLLLQAARMMPCVQFKVAGEKAGNFDVQTVPENVELMGFMSKEQLADFYTGADKVVLTSSCYEGFPLTVIEAMYYNATVVVPNWAALPEIVDDGACGVLYKANSITDLVSKLSSQYDFGDKPHHKVVKNYASQQYYDNIMRCI